MVNVAALRSSETTRRNILMAAFVEFYQHSFQGGSLNHIVESAGITKGALFHHFSGKHAVGYAVVDEVIEPLLLERWLDPIVGTSDPVDALQGAFRRFVNEDIASGAWLHGCPLNNLAQEMSPLDDGFQRRIDALYCRWRSGFADAFSRGIAAGTVRSTVSPTGVAALLVAAQMGVWGSGKSSRDSELMQQTNDAVCSYLDSLRPAVRA